MYVANKNPMQCSEFDLLLTEAMDGQLTGDQLLRFEQHKTSCAACSAMFADVSAGFKWLGQLEEVESPRNLVHNILVATSGVVEKVSLAKSGDTNVRLSFADRVRGAIWPIFAPVFTSRFAMTAAVAFFSVTVSLNAGGVKLKNLARIDLSP